MPPMANAAVIRVAGLGKSYETAAGLFPALKGVDLDVRPGEFIAIMGPSGSGKSTFMNLLGCLDTPTVGDYYLAGENVAQMDKDALALLRNRTLGFVFQGFNLLPRMNLQDNVALPLLLDRQVSVLGAVLGFGLSRWSAHTSIWLEMVTVGSFAFVGARLIETLAERVLGHYLPGAGRLRPVDDPADGQTPPRRSRAAPSSVTPTTPDNPDA